jgi:hypothetical protein
MKRRIDYESNTVLPDIIVRAFNKAEDDILENKNEEDKILLHLAHLRHVCLIWFSTHEIIMKEENDELQGR